jgi:hypothetical protein
VNGHKEGRRNLFCNFARNERRKHFGDIEWYAIGGERGFQMSSKRLCALTCAVVLAALGVFVSGCATKGGKNKKAGQEQISPANPKVVFEPGTSTLPAPGTAAAAKVPAPTEPFEQPRVTIKLPATTLGLAVRQIGEAAKPSLVLMSGIENSPLASVSFRNEKFEKVVEALSAESNLKNQRCPHYVFVYPTGYEALEAVSVSGKVDPAFNIGVQGMAFGSGLHLYTVFSWLSLALDVTVVADNSIAEAQCGELVLGNVPLTDAIDAILKSARVVKFSVDSTGEFIFISTPGNKSAASNLLNEDALSDAHKAFLEKKVNVFLPQAPAEGQSVEMALGPKPLGEVLASLSEQFGMKIVAEEGLEKLPVNPAVLRGVRGKTALDLLVRQWLKPDYGYQMVQDRIVIRKR